MSETRVPYTATVPTQCSQCGAYLVFTAAGIEPRDGEMVLTHLTAICPTTLRHTQRIDGEAVARTGIDVKRVMR